MKNKTTPAPNDTQAALSIPRILTVGQQVTFVGAEYEPEIKIGSVLHHDRGYETKVSEPFHTILTSPY